MKNDDFVVFTNKFWYDVHGYYINHVDLAQIITINYSGWCHIRVIKGYAVSKRSKVLYREGSVFETHIDYLQLFRTYFII